MPKILPPFPLVFERSLAIAFGLVDFVGQLSGSGKTQFERDKERTRLSCQFETFHVLACWNIAAFSTSLVTLWLSSNFHSEVLDKWSLPLKNLHFTIWERDWISCRVDALMNSGFAMSLEKIMSRQRLLYFVAKNAKFNKKLRSVLWNNSFLLSNLIIL